MLNNPFGVAAFLLLRNDLGWKLLSSEEKEIIHQANREHNVEREDYASPAEYGAERFSGGENWDNYSPETHGLRGDSIAKTLARYSPTDVLEIGPGAGFYTNQIASHESVKSMTLVDLGEAFLEFLRPKLEVLKEDKPDFDYNLVVKDAKDLSGDEATYDAVFMSSAVHHIPDRIALFEILARVVRPGGVIVCFDPSHYLERLVRLSKRMRPGGYLRKSYYMDRTNLSTHQMCTYGEYKKICKSTGAFVIDEVSYVPSIKLGLLAKISKRWASTEIFATLRRL
ncbi:MAG: methyltransferase domain-containing protein [Chloroflexi bacterium]|nr:methyltransferase domain-containing protein [Chloroflexota bacterium]